MRKKIISILLAIVMLVGVIPFGAISAFAAEGVKYLEYNTETGAFDELTCTDYTPLENGVTTWSGGWYVAPEGKLELGDVNVNGTAYLILTDECELIVNGGIHINNGSSFTIYAQSDGENAGVLTANGGEYSAGIGSVNWGSCGDITIDGGNITANGGNTGAGIGNGNNGSCGNITINGGKVRAKGGNSDQYGDVGNGIGNGYRGTCGDITINGGDITTIGADSIAQSRCYGGNGIGNDYNGTCGKVIINGGYIAAAGGKASVKDAICGKPFEAEVVLGEHISVFDRINEGIIVTDNAGEKNYCDTFNFLSEKGTSGCPVSAIFAFENELSGNAVKYYEFDGELGIAIANYKYIDFDSASSIKSETRSLTSGWYKVDGEVKINGTLAVTGNVHLILLDGCKLTVSYGVLLEKENSLSVYAGAKGTGQLIATGNYVDSNHSAGIGGNNNDAGDLTIYGGNVTATGVSNAAGIGGGDNGSGGTVTVYDGSVTATGGSSGAGIGGGNRGNGGTVNIYGGNINAVGGDRGAGIGGGAFGNGGNVTVYGGSVTAKGGNYAAGIGGGQHVGENGGTLNIYGGNINAVGGEQAAGIGGGDNSSGAEIHIGGGSVIAVGGEGYSACSGEITQFANAKLYNRRDGSAINGEWHQIQGEDGYYSYIGPVNNTAVKDAQGRNTVCFYAISDISRRTRYLAYNTSTEKIEKKSIAESMVSDINGLTTWNLPWYEVDGNQTINSTVTVNGNVNLILKDGCKLEAKGGINVSEGNSLTIYAQSDSENMGILKAYGQHFGAGIGGAEGQSGGKITIHGGKIEAIGGEGGGAGIGGGCYYIEYEFDEDRYDYKIYECGTAGEITIYGGDVTAKGGYEAAGIGGGYGCDGGKVNIYGDKVNAMGGATSGYCFEDNVKGIGCGWFDISPDNEPYPLDWANIRASYPVEGGGALPETDPEEEPGTEPGGSQNTPESNLPTNPDTGDTENIVLWIVAFTASSTVFAVCLIYGKKRKKAE